MIVEVIAKELEMEIWDPDAPVWNTGTGHVLPFHRVSFNSCWLVLDEKHEPSPFNELWNPETLIYEIRAMDWFPMQITLTDKGVTIHAKRKV